jgi:hypothetical protein
LWWFIWLSHPKLKRKRSSSVKKLAEEWGASVRRVALGETATDDNDNEKQSAGEAVA